MIHVVMLHRQRDDPVDDIYKINEELEAYNWDCKRLQVIAANKHRFDIPRDEDPVGAYPQNLEPKGVKVFAISGVSGAGIKELVLCKWSVETTGTGSPITFEQEYFPEEELIPYWFIKYTVEKKMVCM